MRRFRILFTGVIVLSAAVGLSAQKLLLNQAYLNQFPSVESLRAAVKNSDAVDSYARFMAALRVINDLMLHDLLEAPNGTVYDMPPAADRVQDRYGDALARFGMDSPEPQSKDPRFDPLREKYEKDPAFLDSLLLKFFTPQFRADYYAWVRKPVPAATAAKAGSTISATDPSIAKAKAAKVDISLFAGSIKFGDPLQLPACRYEQTMIGVSIRGSITQDCVDTPSPTGGINGGLVDVIGAIMPFEQQAADPDLKQVFLAADHRPTWMSGESAWVRMHGGVIVRVVIPTKGRAVENRVGQELKAKYGATYISGEGIITPDAGNEFKVHNLEWFLPGMHVDYKVIEVDENGRVKVDGPGYVRIETDSAYRRRVGDEKKKEEKRVL